jgi:hypothetical protein
MSNYDDMPAEQAVWAYSSMLYDSRQERDSLRRELNIVINQLTDLQTDYQRLAGEYERIARAVFCPDCAQKMATDEQ